MSLVISDQADCRSRLQASDSVDSSPSSPPLCYGAGTGQPSSTSSPQRTASAAAATAAAAALAMAGQLRLLRRLQLQRYSDATTTAAAVESTPYGRSPPTACHSGDKFLSDASMESATSGLVASDEIGEKNMNNGVGRLDFINRFQQAADIAAVSTKSSSSSSALAAAADNGELYRSQPIANVLQVRHFYAAITFFILAFLSSFDNSSKYLYIKGRISLLSITGKGGNLWSNVQSRTIVCPFRPPFLVHRRDSGVQTDICKMLSNFFVLIFYTPSLIYL